MRVLLVSSHPVQYAAPLYRRYAADPRLDVTVAYCSLQGAEAGVDPEFGVEVAWDVPLLDGYRWVHPPNRSPWPSLQGFWGLVNPGMWRLVRRGKFDVVVCYGYRAASLWIAAAAAKLSGAALVLTTDAHTLAPRNRRTWKVPVKRWLLRRIFRVAGAVFAPSSRTRKWLTQLGVDRGGIFLTPHVVDVDRFAKSAGGVDKRAARRGWGVDQDATVVLFCGKLVRWKRPEDLIDAVAGLDGVEAVFAGEGPLRSQLESRARQLGCADRVRFLGFVNQTALPGVYAAADVLVLPSEYEPFGLVVNEAFACGLPAVVSEACGAAGDLVVDGETGFVIPVGDVPVLRSRLERVTRDATLRGELARKAQARIGEWGPDRNVEVVVEACQRLAGVR